MPAAARGDAGPARPPARRPVAGVDLSAYSVARVAGAAARRRGADGDVTALPFTDGGFDLVLCLEVLEHLDDPAAAVRELARVARRRRRRLRSPEPWFRLGSLLRGKYVRSLGNHPEHVNQFNRRRLATLLEPAVDVRGVRSAFPWLIAHGRVRA